MNNLTSMEFTIRFDRPITKEHYISPGGYSINSKSFDFLDMEGYKQNDYEVEFHVHSFDKECYDSIITKDDIKKPFDEFFIYTGEYDEPEIMPIEIKDLVFTFNDEDIEYSKENLKLLNEYIKKEYNN